jgi:hypothetical protein
MIPVKPPLSNAVFHPPSDLDHTQVFSIHAYKNAVSSGFTQLVFAGEVPPGSNLDGANFIVTAWKPTDEELAVLVKGGCIFLSCLAVLPPHFLTTDWNIATYGQGEA